MSEWNVQALGRWDEAVLYDGTRGIQGRKGSLILTKVDLVFVTPSPDPGEEERETARWPIPRLEPSEDRSILAISELAGTTTVEVGLPDRTARISVSGRVSEAIKDALLRAGAPEELPLLSKAVQYLNWRGRSALVLLLLGLLPDPNLPFALDVHRWVLLILGGTLLVTIPRPWMFGLGALALLADGIQILYAGRLSPIWALFDLWIAWNNFRIFTELSPLTLDTDRWEWIRSRLEDRRTSERESLPGFFTRFVALCITGFLFILVGGSAVKPGFLGSDSFEIGLTLLLALLMVWLLAVALVPARLLAILPASFGDSPFRSLIWYPLVLTFFATLVVGSYLPAYPTGGLDDEKPRSVPFEVMLARRLLIEPREGWVPDRPLDAAIVKERAVPPVLRDQGHALFLEPSGRIRRAVALAGGKDTAKTAWMTRSRDGVIVETNIGSRAPAPFGGTGPATLVELYDLEGSQRGRVEIEGSGFLAECTELGAVVLSRWAGPGPNDNVDTVVEVVPGRTVCVGRLKVDRPASKPRPQGLGQPRLLEWARPCRVLALTPGASRILVGRYASRTEKATVALFDGGPLPLYEPRLPGLNELNIAALAPDGSRVFVAGTPATAGDFPTGVLIDAKGAPITSSSRWGTWSLDRTAAQYRADLGGFLMGGESRIHGPTSNLVRIRADGRTMFDFAWNTLLLEGTSQTLAVTVQPGRIAAAHVVDARLRISIIDFNGGIRWSGVVAGEGATDKDAAKTYEVAGPTLDPAWLKAIEKGRGELLSLRMTGSFLTLRLGRELRIYRLTAR